MSGWAISACALYVANPLQQIRRPTVQMNRSAVPVRSSEPHERHGQACTDLNSLCYNSARAWTDARRCDSLRMVFGSFSYCPFGTENWLYSVELIEAGETVDSGTRQ
jgi:hypothetical protein